MLQNTLQIQFLSILTSILTDFDCIESFFHNHSFIQNDRLRNLYEDTIYTYSGLIQCIETIGNGKKFYYNSLHSLEPHEQDVENAKFILHFHNNVKAFRECRFKIQLYTDKKFFRAYSKTRLPTTLNTRHKKVFLEFDSSEC